MAAGDPETTWTAIAPAMAPTAALPPPALPPAVLPFPVVAPYRVVPAPRPLTGSPHVEVDAAWPGALRRRLERLATDRDGVLVRDPLDRDEQGLAQALRQAWDLLGLARHGARVEVPLLGVRVDLAAATATRTGPSTSPAATAALVGLRGVELLAVGWLLACSDDLVVLRRTSGTELRAELLAVCFPSGWPPRLRAGASLLELHSPVADNERLQQAAPALSAALLTKGPLRQHVWGLDPDGRLDRDPSAPDPPTGPGPADPAAWWLRVERQTSIPLPGLDRALFTIRPHLVPLAALSPERCAVLADAVASMSPAALDYKGIAHLAADLVAWLRTRVS